MCHEDVDKSWQKLASSLEALRNPMSRMVRNIGHVPSYTTQEDEFSTLNSSSVADGTQIRRILTMIQQLLRTCVQWDGETSKRIKAANGSPVKRVDAVLQMGLLICRLGSTLTCDIYFSIPATLSQPLTSLVVALDGTASNSLSVSRVLALLRIDNSYELEIRCRGFHTISFSRHGFCLERQVRNTPYTTGIVVIVDGGTSRGED
jgi:hypothetical protein